MRQPSSHLSASAPQSPALVARRRREDLSRLLPLWPKEIADVSHAGRLRIVRLLAKALREERCRARAGHWAYDLSRHAQLARLYKAESEEFAKFERAAGGRRG
jgi:hypothetical protein